MIVGAIKRELTENMALTIKIIYSLLRAKFLDINHSYSRIWQDREEAIAIFFVS
jgi:hypothetical protein